MILDCSKYVGPCRCGREHTLETKKVVVEYNALDKFDQYMDCLLYTSFSISAGGTGSARAGSFWRCASWYSSPCSLTCSR